MAPPTPEEVRRLLSDINPAQQASATLLGQELNPPGGERLQQVGFYNLYLDQTTGAYMVYDADGYPRPATNAEIIAVQKAMESEGGPAGRDSALARLTEEEILNAQQERELAASEEARAAEMQPYNIAESQSQVEYEKRTAEIAQKNLERQMVSDKFDRAQEIFNSSFLAQQLAEEKKKTATSLLTSIVDNLVPPGMTSLPGIPGSTMPTVAQIDWSQLGGGLNPQTDQALQYLMGLQ
jgi:hypothetical protein